MHRPPQHRHEVVLRSKAQLAVELVRIRPDPDRVLPKLLSQNVRFRRPRQMKPPALVDATRRLGMHGKPQRCDEIVVCADTEGAIAVVCILIDANLIDEKLRRKRLRLR